MIHEHRRDAKNSVHIYELKHEGKGIYHCRGIFPGFKEGDQVQVTLCANILFDVESVISIEDSKGYSKINKPI